MGQSGCVLYHIPPNFLCLNATERYASLSRTIQGQRNREKSIIVSLVTEPEIAYKNRFSARLQKGTYGSWTAGRLISAAAIVDITCKNGVTEVLFYSDKKHNFQELK